MSRIPTRCAPRSAREIARYDLEADVVVVGLGMAGACAALEAQRAGADVLVLERASGGGGTSANSGGLDLPGRRHAGAEGLRLRGHARGDVPLPASPPRSPAPTRRRSALFCEGSVEHFHWLEAQGVPFKRSFHPGARHGVADRRLPGLQRRRGLPSVERARAAGAARAQAADAGEGGALPDAVRARGGGAQRAARRARHARGARWCATTPTAAIVGVVARRAGEDADVRARRGVVLCRRRLRDERRDAAAATRRSCCAATCATAWTATTAAASAWGRARAATSMRMGHGEVALPTTIPNRLGARHLREPPRPALHQRGHLLRPHRHREPLRQDGARLPAARRRHLRASTYERRTATKSTHRRAGQAIRSLTGRTRSSASGQQRQPARARPAIGRRRGRPGVLRGRSDVACECLGVHRCTACTSQGSA